jgi:ABC-type transport system substrate-binding protein
VEDQDSNASSPKPNIINDITPGKPVSKITVGDDTSSEPSADTPIEITSEGNPDTSTEEPTEPGNEPTDDASTDEVVPDDVAAATTEPDTAVEEPAEEPSEPAEPSTAVDEPVSAPTEAEEPVVAEEPAVPAEAPEAPAAENELSSPTDDKPQIVTPSKAKAKKSGKFLKLLIILILLAAIGGGAYYWVSHKSTSKSNASATVVKKDIPNIRYATSSEGWESFYPNIDASNNYLESNVMIFEGLVRFQNKTQIVPLLATGWTNPDSSTWVFNLRKNVTFHDGKTMTAQDVKDSFDAAKDTAFGKIDASTISSVTVTGPLQVTIKTDGPDPTLLKKLTAYFVYDTKSGKDNDPVNGTGPFVVKPGTTPAPSSLELVAYDKYWGGRPHVRSFSFVGLDQDDGGKSYADGKATLVVADSGVKIASGTRPAKSQTLDDNSIFNVVFNTLKPGTPLAKLQVRQAIQYSVDPLPIAKTRGDQAGVASQTVPSSIPGYNPNLKPVTRDITKAKQLLTAAGYPKGLSFTLTYFAQSQDTAVEIQKELAEAGITVNLDPQTEVKTLAAKAEGGGTDAFFQTESSDIFDASDVLNNYVDTPNYANPAISALLTKASSTLDQATRLGYLQQSMKLFTEDVGVVPVYTVKSGSLVYEPSYVITRDIEGINLGIYFQNVYAK